MLDMVCPYLLFQVYETDVTTISGLSHFPTEQLPVPVPGHSYKHSPECGEGNAEQIEH